MGSPLTQHSMGYHRLPLWHGFCGSVPGENVVVSAEIEMEPPRSVREPPDAAEAWMRSRMRLTLASQSPHAASRRGPSLSWETPFKTYSAGSLHSCWFHRSQLDFGLSSRFSCFQGAGQSVGSPTAMAIVASIHASTLPTGSITTCLVYTPAVSPRAANARSCHLSAGSQHYVPYPQGILDRGTPLSWHHSSQPEIQTSCHRHAEHRR